MVMVADEPKPTLTPQQMAVLRLALRGKTHDQIAADLGISLWTVRRHLENVRQRYGVYGPGWLFRLPYH